MKSSRLLFMVLPALCVLTPVFLSAQVDTVWVHRWTGPGAESDWAYAIAVDDSGHVYVTGKNRAFRQCLPHRLYNEFGRR